MRRPFLVRSVHCSGISSERLRRGCPFEAKEEVAVAAGRQRQSGDSAAPSRPGQRRKDFERRRRSCWFCKEKIAEIDYKNVGQLRRFISEKGKIRGRGNTGT